MLRFEDNFFKEEERCGFVVCEKMKRAWAAELDLLTRIISICKRHGIQYYAVWGTLLGAVRHQGFVPWDDDIDIALKREDYMRLLPILSRELPGQCCVYSIYKNKRHYQPTACVTNYPSLPLPQDIIDISYGCPYIVGVDIYALDYMPRDEGMEETQFQLYNVVYDMAQRYEEIAREGNTEQYLQKIEEFCGVNLVRDDTIRNQLWLLCDRISSMFREEESDCLTMFQRRVRGDLNFKLKKEWFESVEERNFENINISVPVGYHEILTHMYGDYSVLRRGGGAHTYPFYRAQEEFLCRLTGR